MNDATTAEPLAPPVACTFSESDWRVLAGHWYPVARVQDIAEQPVSVTLLDVALVIYRTSAGLRIARDLCPHRGVPLSMGWVEGNDIICRYHGLRYGPDGRCNRIPAQPEMTRIPPRLRVRMFPVVERYGLIWTSLHAHDPLLPELPTWDDPQHQPILPPPVDIAGSAGRQLEGFIDVAHFAWIHHEAFADRNDAVVPAYETELTARGFQTRYWSAVSNYPKAVAHLAPPGFRWLRVFDVEPPFNARLTVHFPNDGRLCILNAASPVSARKTRLFVPLTRNFDQTGSLDDVYAFNAQIFAEDQAIIEAQKPEELPLDPSAEAHFAADKSSAMYRRFLVEMGLGK